MRKKRPSSDRRHSHKTVIERPKLLPAIRPGNALSPHNEYRVGPGRPPREYQFRKGQSGNPLGAKLKKRSIAADLKAILERALRQTMPKKDGERLVTKAAAGMQQLVDQFARGEHPARRDLIQLTGKLGVDLTAGQGDALHNSIVKAMSQNDQELVDDFIQHVLAEKEAERQAMLRNSNSAKRRRLK
jgi:hypothetical protein